MIYLHKLLPMVLLPSGLSIALISLGLMLRKRALCWSGLVVLWLGSSALVSNAAMLVSEGWQMSVAAHDVPLSRAVVVLSGGLSVPRNEDSDGEWTSATANRFDAGIELYRSGRAQDLVFTGTSPTLGPPRPSVGDFLAERALRAGIPERNIHVTRKVWNTSGEAEAVADLLRGALASEESRRVILVTSAFHMRRARLIFEAEGLPVVTFPVDFRASTSTGFSFLSLLPSAANLYRCETALRELLGYLYYSLLLYVQSGNLVGSQESRIGGADQMRLTSFHLPQLRPAIIGPPGIEQWDIREPKP